MEAIGSQKEKMQSTRTKWQGESRGSKTQEINSLLYKGRERKKRRKGELSQQGEREAVKGHLVRGGKILHGGKADRPSTIQEERKDGKGKDLPPG